MKRFIIYGLLAAAMVTSFSRCSDCKKCHAEAGLGGASIQTPEQELCGDDLKKAEKTPGMVCK